MLPVEDAEDGAAGGADGIGEQGPPRAGQLAVLQQTGFLGDADQRAYGIEEGEEEENEHDQRGLGIAEEAGQVQPECGGLGDVGEADEAVGFDEALQPGDRRGHGDASEDGTPNAAGEEQSRRYDPGERRTGGWRAEIAEADVRPRHGTVPKSMPAAWRTAGWTKRM